EARCTRSALRARPPSHHAVVGERAETRQYLRLAGGGLLHFLLNGGLAGAEECAGKDDGQYPGSRVLRSHRPSLSSSSVLASAGFTRPPERLITCPTKKPRRPDLPSRYSVTLPGWAASTSSTMAATTASSLTWRSPRASTIRAGSP